MFTAAILEDAIGGFKQLDEGFPNTNTLICSSDFVGLGPDNNMGNLAMCDTAEGHIDQRKWGWLEIRKKGNAGPSSEHALISTASAERSGLLATQIFEPFWFRYATQDSYVASPEALDDEDRQKGDMWVAAQSWLPTGGRPGSTHTARSIALLDLSQLPDDSSSIADFSAGNELCPLSGMEGYAGRVADACHEFRQALGATNVTHFKPLNRAMWTYYHTLARRRMRQCSALEVLNAHYYEDWDYYWDWSPEFLSAHDTEVHECEREAMTYEMFAQHFLQDAWATGHMWRRWGRASIPDFPYSLRGEEPSTIPTSNWAVRKTAIAQMVAVGVGIVHGDKSVLLEEFFHNSGNSADPSVLDTIGPRSFTNDPLNSPEYRLLPFLPESVYWATPRMAGEKFKGGGDMFWLPTNAPLGQVGSDPRFEEQRNRLLNCGAASMLEAYRDGPMRHGAPVPTQFGGDIDNIDLQSDYCWGQLATNRSMAAAVGLTDATYGVGLVTGFGAGMVGRFLVGKRRKGLAFPAEDSLSIDQEANRVAIADWKTFSDKLGDQFAEDLSRIKRVYERHAKVDPDGVAAAKGEHIDGGPIRLLGVDGAEDVDAATLAAMSEPDVPPMAPPGVPYVDRLVSDLPASDPKTDLQLATSRMLWRGNMAETCHATLKDDAALLNGLQQRCLNNATIGGDADACTECVYRAAQVLPVCVGGGTHIGGSMCSDIGAIPNAHAPGLPDWWFDGYRLISPANIPTPWAGSTGLCQHPYFVALQWCSGTMTTLAEMNMQDPSYGEYDERERVQCSSGFFGDTRTFGVTSWRKGRMLTEFLRPDPLDPEAIDPTQYLLPMFTAFSGTTELKHGADACDKDAYYSVSSQTPVLIEQLAPADTADYVEAYVDTPDVPRCGIQQRVSWWQSTCASAMQKLEYVPSVSSGASQRSQLTGEQWEEWQTADGPLCSIQEPRSFVTTCADPRLTCNAGWQCTPPVQPPLVRTIATYQQQ